MTGNQRRHDVLTSLLASALDGLAAVRPDDLDDAELAELVKKGADFHRQIQALETTWIAATVERDRDRAIAQHPDDPRAGQKAATTTKQQLSEELRLSPSQVKQAVETGRQLAESPTLHDAATTGALSAEHMRVIRQVTDPLVGTMREALQNELAEVGARLEPVAFGRYARRRLAELDTAAAQEALDRNRGRQRATLTRTPTGMLQLFSQSAGLDAEYIETAIRAFRRPDADGELRSPERRTHDALVEVCRAALDEGRAPTEHGVRPHVLVTMTQQQVDGSASGPVETASGEPLPSTEVEHLTDDCELTRIVLGAKSLPIDVSEATRNVRLGLWKALLVRDKGCRFPGCDAPASWTDVAHGSVPYRRSKSWKLDDCLLLCRRHHRKVDRPGWKIVVHDDAKVSFHRPDGRILVSNAPNAPP